VQNAVKVATSRAGGVRVDFVVSNRRQNHRHRERQRKQQPRRQRNAKDAFNDGIVLLLPAADARLFSSSVRMIASARATHLSLSLSFVIMKKEQIGKTISPHYDDAYGRQRR
jgi:hypothetical protein